jgi:predicted RNase H-like HicB family nuclease
MHTAVYFEGEDVWLVGYVRELPGAFAQGRNLGDLWQNLRDARELVLSQIIRENKENFAGLAEAGPVEME